MTITRSNYESWFLDFLEGNLDPSLEDEFREFLRQNPDLAIEMEMWEPLALRANGSIHFDAIVELKKTVINTSVEFQELAVAYHEGDLSLPDRINFEAELSENPVLAADVKMFGKLKLSADQSIVYPDKEKLKRRGTIFPLWTKVASVAAMLILAYLLFLPPTGVPHRPGQLAEELKNRDVKIVVAPEVKIKAEKKSTAIAIPSSTPVQIPAKVPVKQNQHPEAKTPAGTAIPAAYKRAPQMEALPLNPRGVNFGLPHNIELAVMTPNNPASISGDMELSELLKVQLAAMRNSDDRELFSTDHLGLSGLQLFAKLSGKRLTARKGDDGTVHSVSFNSRLLAISIPVNR